MRDRRTQPQRPRRHGCRVLLVCCACCSCEVYEDRGLKLGSAEAPQLDAAISAGVDGSIDASVSKVEPSAGSGRGTSMRRAPTTMPVTAAGNPTPRSDPSAADGGGDPDATISDHCPDDNDPIASARCADLVDALAHRYRFEGVGDMIVDTRGAAHGATRAPLMGTGALTLSGNPAGYATLPAGLLSAFPSVTIELWFTWFGGDPDQPLLSFGTAEPTAPHGMCSNAELWSGSWYRFCKADGAATWWKARGLCEAAGGTLAAIESAAEHQHLISHPAFTESVWIGGNDLQVEGQWYFANANGLQGGAHFWSGDERGSAPAGAFQAWRRDQPTPDDSDPTADCTYIFKGDNAWVTFPCDTNGSFICEWHGHQGQHLARGLTLTPASPTGTPTLTLQLNSPTQIQSPKPLPQNQTTHLAIVLDGPNQTATLYIEGQPAASEAINSVLNDLTDIDNWLGRGHLTTHPGLNAAVTELRIYNRALTPQELALTHSAGPDPAFLKQAER